jgi:hypothetical protein
VTACREVRHTRGRARVTRSRANTAALQKPTDAAARARRAQGLIRHVLSKTRRREGKALLACR